QKAIELVLAEHRAQRRLRKLARGGEKVHHLDHGPLWIHDPEIDHGVDLDRHVVPGDDILWRHVEHDDAQVDLDHLLHERNEKEQTRSLDPPEAAELEHDAPLVLAQDAQRPEQDQYDDDDDAHAESGDHESLSVFVVRDDLEHQPFDSRDAHPLSGVKRDGRAHAPGFPLHARPSFALEVFQHFAGAAENGFASAHDRLPPAANDERADQQE